MNEYNELIEYFVQQNRKLLGDDLVGVYLHGSAVMGCFNSKKSDLDLMIVVREAIPDTTKRAYMDMVVELNRQAPAKGIELSIVKESVCNPFIYPTPFELHFSITHLDRYQLDPDSYIEKMRGTDKDLAAHFTILYHRGTVLFGKAIREVFSEVSRADYLDSIWSDIENAQAEITEDPTYMILNLCRVLAFKKENLILSKAEGGKWGLINVPQKYVPLITDALAEYGTNTSIQIDETLAKEYASYMLNQITCDMKRDLHPPY